MEDITIINEEQADKASSLIYTNPEEAINNMVALVEYWGDALSVWEVDCLISYYSGRGYLILEDDFLEDYKEDLAKSRGVLVNWNPSFEIVRTFNFPRDDMHLATCEKALGECPVCGEAFGVKTGGA